MSRRNLRRSGKWNERDRKESRRSKGEQKKQEKERQQVERKQKRAEKAQQDQGPKRKCRSQPGRNVRRRILRSSESSDDGTSETERPQSSVCNLPSRKTRLLSRFCDSSDMDTDDDGVLCGLCQAREPEGCTQIPLFWIDCDACGEWVHTFCAFGKNSITRQYICENCL